MTTREVLNTQTRYATSDTSKTLQAKNTNTSAFIRVKQILVTVVTAAAQVLTIRSSDSAVILLVIPASTAAGTQFRVGPFEKGIALPANTDLVAASTAGPAFDITAETYFDGVQ